MYIGIELTVICVANIFLLSSHYAARRRGLGSYFGCERGPDGPRYDYAAHFRGLKIPLALAPPIADLSMNG